MPLRPQQPPAVLALAELLANSPVGEIISYDTLNKELGFNLLAARNRWVIGRARDLLNERHGLVYATVRSQGLKRLPMAEGAEYAGEKPLLRIRSAARAGIRRLTNSVRHTNDLSPIQSRQANTRLCALGLIQHLSMSRTVATLPENIPPPVDGLEPLRAALNL